ncbi:hypothetical protein HYX13_03930 [Candidatus Woesearchaeota archaeon]|nr:hypothetical protein [Candidatus Woesearchaeota archaeon]
MINKRKLLSKRGALQLPITILVAIIFSMVLFAGGIYFLNSITKSTEKVGETQLEKQTAAQIQQQFQQGEKITLLPLQKELQPEEHFLFALGIINTRKQAEEFRFEIELIEITDNSKTTNEKKIDSEENELTTKINFAKEEWFVYDHSFLKIPQNSKATWNFLVKVPADTPAARYSFLATVYDTQGEKYGNAQLFSVIVLGKPLKEKNLIQDERVKEECAKDLSCDAYFIFVPLGNWQTEEGEKGEEEFQQKVQIRGEFFQDITQFKFKKTGILPLPFSFVKNCNLQNLEKDKAQDHLYIKSCADRYADSLGITYEKAIGLSPKFEGGKTFFGQKEVYASLGFASGTRTAERPGIVAHELGHSYYLCDEYEFQTYQTQNRHLTHTPCKNLFPSSCSPQQKDCLGNTPTFRNYAGTSTLNICQGKTQYSVMGFSTGAECGYDATGGYDAIS